MDLALSMKTKRKKKENNKTLKPVLLLINGNIKESLLTVIKKINMRFMTPNTTDTRDPIKII